MSKIEEFEHRSSPELDIERAIESGLTWIDKEQTPEGFWVGMLETNCCMEAEWLMAFHILGIKCPDADKIVSGILSKQRSDGAWDTYHDAPNGDINTTVESYAALRISGMSANSDELRLAREWILSHGGLGKVRVFTRYWLAMLGEWPWEKTPNLPPEIIWLPKWVPFNIYHFSSWARATLVPLCVLSSMRFVRPLSNEQQLDELFPDGRDNFDYSLPTRSGFLSWEKLFLGLDRCLHFFQRLKITPGRRSAAKHCLEWIVRHQDADGAWGGIQPPWIYSVISLYASGYDLHNPNVSKAISALNDHWSYERDGHRFIQACESPVWDTLLTLLAMQDCNRSVDNHQVMSTAIDWILDKECEFRGDWAQLTPNANAGGWAFERANVHYPDIDDTAVAILVLARAQSDSPNGRIDVPLQRAIEWVLAMQSDNGGWGAFDRNNHTEIITKIPFCDFGEVLDPPSADVTAHVVEALAHAGYKKTDSRVRSAINYLWEEQEPAGCWFGRWGVNYIYGTAAVLPALAAAGEDMQQERVIRAVDWLLAHQNSDGSWGETCASYMDLSLAGKGEGTASQTAWAMMALLATFEQTTPAPAVKQALLAAIDYLVRTQKEGTWDEAHHTGTGFPGYGFGARLEEKVTAEPLQQGVELSRAFMLNYNLYRHYFPLIALGRARNQLGSIAS